MRVNDRARPVTTVTQREYDSASHPDTDKTQVGHVARARDKLSSALGQGDENGGWPGTSESDKRLARHIQLQFMWCSAWSATTFQVKGRSNATVKTFPSRTAMMISAQNYMHLAKYATSTSPSGLPHIAALVRDLARGWE